MDQQGFSRKFSHFHKNNSEERVRRKKLTSQVQRDETPDAKAKLKKLSFKPVEQTVAEAKSRMFSQITEKDLLESGKRNLRRLSQADIPSSSDEYKTVLEDLQDVDAQNNLSKKLSKHEEKTRVTNELRKISCTDDYTRGRSSRKVSASTFPSPKLGSRTLTLPVVPEVNTASFYISGKTAWLAKSTSPLHCCSHQRKSHERPKRHISLPCPPKLETSFDQENRKLEVTKLSDQYPLVVKNEIRIVQSEKNRKFSATRSSNAPSKRGHTAESVRPEIRYEQDFSLKHNRASSFLSMKANFKSLGKASLAAKILVENYYRQQQFVLTEDQADEKSMAKLFDEMKTCRYLRFRDERTNDFKNG